MSLPFTHLTPDGIRRGALVCRSPNVERIGKDFIARGGRFDAEFLQTGGVSLTAQVGERVLASEVCLAGPDIPRTIDRLVRAAHRRLML